MSRYIAIDVDAAGLFVVAGSARGTAVRVEQAVPLTDDPLPLTPNAAADLGKRLKEALGAARVAAAPVLVCVGRDRVVLKDIRHPKTAPAEEPAVVRFQAQRDLAEPPDTLHLDYVPLPSPPNAAEKRATAVFVKKDLFNAARTMCEAAGLKLAGFTPRPYATAAAIRQAVAAGTATPPENPSAPVAVLSLWDGGGEFVVYHGEHLAFSRNVSGMALQSESALVGEAKRSLAAFASQAGRERLDCLYLCEGHTAGGSWAARLQQSLPLPVHPFDPLAGQPAEAGVRTDLRGRFLSAVGLLAARGHGPLPINFVTPRQPRAEPSKGRAWVLVGLLLFILVAGGIAGGVYYLHSSLDRRFATANKKKKDAEEGIKEAEKEVNKLKAVEEFRTRDVVWLDLFYDYVSASPDVDKVRLKEFDGKFKTPKQEAKSSSAVVVSTRQPGAATAAGGAKPGAGTPAKSKAIEPVAELRLELVSASDAEDPLVAKLVEELFQSQSTYFAKPDVDHPPTAGGKRQAVVRVDLLPRKPDTYNWKLNAKFPERKQPLPPVEPPPADPIFIDEGNQP